MIPRIIHQTYPTKNLPPILAANRQALIRANPHYEVRLYTDHDIDNYIERYFPSCSEYYRRINYVYGAARADFFRYAVLLREGGIYLDIKAAASVPLKDVLPRDVDFVLSHWPVSCSWGKHPEVLDLGLRGEFLQWFIACTREHPFMSAALAQVIANIESYSEEKHGVGKMGVIRTTGPIAYTLGVYSTMKFAPSYIVLEDLEKLGLYYSVFSNPTAHQRLFAPHYSQLTSPVVLFD